MNERDLMEKSTMEESVQWSLLPSTPKDFIGDLLYHQPLFNLDLLQGSRLECAWNLLLSQEQLSCLTIPCQCYLSLPSGPLWQFSWETVQPRYPLPKNNTKETFVPCCWPQGWLYSSDPNDLLVYFMYNSRQFNRTVSWLLACSILTDLSMFLDTFCQNVQILELSLQPFSVVGTPYQQGAGSLGMSMDNSGVVGKFRSFYSTIEQVRSFLFSLALRVSTNKYFFYEVSSNDA